MPEKDQQPVENVPQPTETPASASPLGRGAASGPTAAAADEPTPFPEEGAPNEASDAPQEPTQPEETPPAPPKPPSKIQRFLRKLWRWTLAFLVVFGLGFVAASWTLYRPARRKIAQAQQDARQAAQQAQTLQNQLQQSQSQVKSLQEQVSSLQSNLQQARLQAALDRVLAEAYAVRVALQDDDATGAALHADGLGKALEALAAVVPPEHANVVQAMQSQFSDIRQNLDSPTYADRQLRTLVQHVMALEDVLGLK